MHAQLPGALRPIHDTLLFVADHWLALGAEAVWLSFDTGGSGDWKDVPLAFADVDRFDEPTCRARLDLAGVDIELRVRGPGEEHNERLLIDATLLARLASAQCDLADLAESLIEANDQLLSLYRLAASSASSLTMEALATTVADDVVAHTPAEAALVLTALGPTSLSGDAGFQEPLRAAALRLEHRDHLLLRAGEDAPVDIAVHRLGGDGDILALAGPASGRFSLPDLQLIRAVADSSAGLLRLASVHERELAQAVVAHDVETAAALSASLLPRQLPTIPGLDLAARCDPARLAGGDFYVVVPTETGLIFAVGDVAGKGLPAALVMAMVSSAMTAAANRARDTDPAALLADVARDVSDYLSQSSLFVTAVVGRYHSASTEIEVANAGHSPVVLVGDMGLQRIPASRPPLGVCDELPATIERAPFKPGHFLVLATDGLAEQEAPDGAMFGYDEFDARVGKIDTESASEIVDALFEAVERHGEGELASDDRTALVLRRTEVVR